MLSLPHLIIVFLVALVVFGPEKLPELAKNAGKFMAEFRRMTGEFKSTFEGHMRELEREAEERRRTPPPVTTPPTIAVSPALPSATAEEPASPAQPDEETSGKEENSIRGHAPQGAANAEPEVPTPVVTPAQGIVPSADPRVPVQHAPATEASNGSHGSREASPISAEEPGETPEPVTDGQHHSS
jgi:TatA/E family protein of Tat protein translocase